MEKNEVQSLIDTLHYDLETVWYLIDYGRANDSVRILDRVLTKIQLFRARAKEGPYDLEGIFPDSFWDKPFHDGLKMGDLCRKIKEIIKQDEASLGDDLEKKRYVHFFWVLRSWINDNISLLKRRTKSPLQKKAIILTLVLAVCLMGICTAFLVDRNFNWGLRGDFYQGSNFEKLVWSANSRNIDFFSCGAMDSHVLLPNPSTPVYTARWKGKLLVPRDGKYVFIVDVDDGARLYIDDQMVLEGWREEAVSQYLGNVYLRKGKHQIRFEYVNFSGDCTVRLFWEGPGINKEVIPEGNFRIH